MEKAKTEKIIEIAKKNAEINSEFVPSSDKLDKQHHQKVVIVWKYIGKFALLIWTIIALARVPFIGSYLDGLFDYLFGQGKYAFYLLAIFVQIGWIFNTGYTRVVRSKRFVVFSLLALLSVCCIISGVANMVNSFDNPPTFQDLMSYYHTTWLEYFKSWSYDTYFNIECISGGILAELISYVFNFLSYVILIIVAAVILFVSVFIIFNINYKSTKVGLAIRGWMIRKLGGSFKYDGYNELKHHRENQNKFKKTKKFDVENTALKNDCIPYSLLPESDVNKFDANFRNARHLQNKLATLFRNNNIECVPTDIDVYTSYSDVCFEAKSKHEINQIIKLQPEIAKATKLDHYNISIRGNIVNIELENVFFSKFSLKTVLNLYDEGKEMVAVFGLDKLNKLCKQNFKNNSSALIVGKKGSGSAVLATLMALSTCYITHPDNLELIVLNPNCESTYSYFNNLPHTRGKQYESINICIDKLHELQNMVDERNSLLRVNNVVNIDQFNRTTAGNQNHLKHIMVLIPNVDALLKDTFQNGKIIADLLINGPKAGIYLIMQSYVINNDILDKTIYDNVTDKYILALASQDESMKVFNNKRGYQLHSNGDCIHFATDKITAMKRIQICNMNYTELTSNIDIIKTFYQAKQRQREAELLTTGDQNETNK